GQPQATCEVRAADGWLRTGDIGKWQDGRLRLVDRARDFIVTAGGKTLSPSYIENILRASPYVAEVAVFGHARKYLTALVEIDFDTVSDWARSKNISYSGRAGRVRGRRDRRHDRPAGRDSGARGGDGRCLREPHQQPRRHQRQAGAAHRRR